MAPLAGFLDPKNDFAFKQIFGKEKHKDILIHFLNDILKLKGKNAIQDVEFLTPIQDPEIAAKKQSMVDVLCKDEKGQQVIIEMQVSKTSGFKERAVYYASKAYSSQMVKGGKYEKLKEVIFIAIVDYALFPDKAHYHSSHKLCDQETYEQDLNGIRFEFLQLPRFHKSLDEVHTMVEKWCYFFKHASQTTPEELKKLVGSDAVIKKAYKVLNSAYWSENELRLYEQALKSENDGLSMLRQAKIEGIEEGRQKGREEGREEGIEQGRRDERLTVARNFLEAGVAVPIIAQSTGLTEAEIEALR